jgi:hypothetical protein
MALLAEELRSAGHDVAHTRDLDLATAEGSLGTV